MSRSSIEVQAGLVGAALAVLCAFGHWTSAAILAGVIAIVGLLLLRAIRAGAQRTADADEEGALVVLRSLLLVVSGPIAAFFLDWLLRRSGDLPHLPFDDGGRVTTVHAMCVLVVVALASLYASSLVDWCYVMPRIRGERGRCRPCQQSMDDRWGALTCWWLLHRLAAILLFVFAIAATVMIAALQWLGFSDPLSAAIGAAATLFAGFYLRRATTVIAFVNNPPVHVGDKVLLADEPQHTPFPDSSYYVVDVAVEGVRLLQLQDGDAMVSPESPRDHDRLLDIEAAFALVRARRRFAACRGEECSGVNPYCPEAGRAREDAAAAAAAAGTVAAAAAR